MEGMTKSTTIEDLLSRVRKEKRLDRDAALSITLDQAGKQPASSTATLQSLRITHGDMLFLDIPKDAAVAHGKGGNISRKVVDGKIVNQTYDDRSRKEGFRPGLMSLRSMKMKWTLRDFQELNAKYTFAMKGNQPRKCAGVSCYTEACNTYLRHARSRAFAPRVAHLYGKRSDDKKTIQVEVFYEPPQSVESGLAVVNDDHSAKTVEKLAMWLGLERVGFAFCHPLRDQDEVGFRISAYELLEAAEQNIKALDDNVDSEKTFAVVVVTNNKKGNVEFDAYEINTLSLQIIQQGALLEDEEEEGLLAVHDTFTVVVEAKPTKKVSTYRCISAVPIAQHGEDKSEPPMRCTFPVRNRGEKSIDARNAIRAHLANAKRGTSHRELVADFQALLALTEVMGLDAVRDLCASVRDKSIPIKEGYKLIIDSLLG